MLDDVLPLIQFRMHECGVSLYPTDCFKMYNYNTTTVHTHTYQLREMLFFFYSFFQICTVPAYMQNEIKMKMPGIRRLEDENKQTIAGLFSIQFQTII